MIDTLAPIDLANPVNVHHPLNLGLISWWLAVPGLDGGKYFYDLCGRNDGTLTNGPTWSNNIPPGAVSRSLSFDGVNDFVSTPITAALGTAEHTMSAWFRTSATNQFGFIIAKDEQSNNFAQFSLMIANGGYKAGNFGST